MVLFRNPYTKYKPMLYTAYKGAQRYNRRSAATTSTFNPGTSSFRVKKRRSGGGGRSFKDRVRNTLAAKHFQTIDTTLQQSLIHNQSYVHSPTMNIVKGTADNNRIGDSIYLEAIKFKMVFHDEDLTTQPAFYKMFIGYVDVDTYTSTGWQTGGLGEATYGNGVAFAALDISDPKKFTKLAEYTIKLPHLVDGTKTAEIVEDEIQLKKTFPYETNQAYGKFKNLVFITVGSVIGGGGGTDTGEVFLTYDLIYKDC